MRANRTPLALLSPLSLCHNLGMMDTESTTQPHAAISVRPVFSASLTTAAGDLIGVVTLTSTHAQLVIARPDGTTVTADMTPAEIYTVSRLASQADTAADLPQAKRA